MPTLSFKGRRVLLIAPRFFGYERDIVEALQWRGAVVDWLPDRPYDSAPMAAATRLAPRLILPFADRLYHRLLEKIGPATYDYVLVINGQTVSKAFLRSLRGNFPSARLILYMWDSLENRGRVVENFAFFDSLLSFDPVTVERYGMRSRALFYTHVRQPDDADAVAYDATFIGTAHSDRFAVISRLREGLDPGLRTFWYLYLQSEWVFNVYRATKAGMRSAKRTDFEYQPMNKKVLQHTFENSLAIIDVEHPMQRGLTMRTLETLGINRKIITTNRHIRDYDFFDEANVALIDRNKPFVDAAFFHEPYKPIPYETFSRYSIDGWIDEVLA